MSTIPRAALRRPWNSESRSENGPFSPRAFFVPKSGWFPGFCSEPIDVMKKYIYIRYGAVWTWIGNLVWQPSRRHLPANCGICRSSMNFAEDVSPCRSLQESTSVHGNQFVLLSSEELPNPESFRLPEIQIQIASKVAEDQKCPFVHNPVCSQFWERSFAILAQRSQFCLRSF